MSGHSKWSTIKRAKGITDAKRGKIFSRFSRDITLAAKDGGGDPEANARLRTVLLQARNANMPMDNIERAIKKGTGDLPGMVFEEHTYEGYGAHGVAFMVRVTTDNKTRAAQEIRATFARGGGNLAQSGAVAFQFLHAGQFLIAQDQADEDKLMEVALEAGADDVISSEEGFDVRCEINQFDKVIHALEEAGIKTESAEISYIPTTTIPITEVSAAKTIIKLQDALDAIDDVQAVFSNEEMDEATRDAAQE